MVCLFVVVVLGFFVLRFKECFLALIPFYREGEAVKHDGWACSKDAKLENILIKTGLKKQNTNMHNKKQGDKSEINCKSFPESSMLQ